MKLLIPPRFSAPRAATRTLYDEIRNSHLKCHLPSSLPRHRSPPTAVLRPFSTTCKRPQRQIKAETDLDIESPKDEPSLSHKIRLLMRRIPHPVAIVTAYSSTSTPSPTSSTTKPTPRGMTVSSFNTVTLSPKPIITFNVRQPSETLSALQTSGRFLVHLLAPTTSMAKLAHNFSRGNANLELDQFEFAEYDCSLGRNTTAAVSSNDDIFNTTTTNNNTTRSTRRTTLPRLAPRNHTHGERTYNDSDNEEGIDSFTFILECKYLPEKSVQVYDHMIVLGSVERILSPGTTPDSDTRHSKEDFCLMYADTRFWTMGEET